MKTIRKLDLKQPDIKKKRVAAYVRVSKDTLKNSFDNQKDYFEKMIIRNSEWEFAGVYFDEGITGVNMKKRTGFLSMISDAEAGLIDVIYVKSVSRFARNTVDTLEYTRLLKSIGVEVIFEKENISSFSDDGELMLTLLASFAQAEAESISQNVKWSRQKCFEQGDPQTRNRLFGYEWVDDNLVIVPAEAEVVKAIYSMYLEDNSTTFISKWLREQGYKTIRGAAFDSQAVNYILRNITYTGNMILGKTRIVNPLTKKRENNKDSRFQSYYVENSHDAIVDFNDYLLVQEKIKKHNADRANGKVRYSCTNVFYHKIKCGYCGYFYCTGKKKNAQNTYFCAWRQAKRERCDNTQIMEIPLKERLCSTFGWNEFNEDIFNDTVALIVVRHGEPLEVHLTSGETIEIQWKWRKKYANSNKATIED